MVLAFCRLRLGMLLAMLYNTRFVRVRSSPVIGRVTAVRKQDADAAGIAKTGSACWSAEYVQPCACVPLNYSVCNPGGDVAICPPSLVPYNLIGPNGEHILVYQLIFLDGKKNLTLKSGPPHSGHPPRQQPETRHSVESEPSVPHTRSINDHCGEYHLPSPPSRPL
jgi:hypothetical protein